MGAIVNEEEIEKGASEYENAIAHTGFGRYNLAVIFMCGGAILTVLVETLGLSYISPAAQCDLQLTTEDKGIISSIGFLGIVCSSLFWGFIADSIGRRKILLVGCLTSSIFGFASSFVNHVWLFILFRFIVGFFIGCPASIVFAYVGEFHSNKYRAKAVAGMGSFIALATFYLPIMAWLILSMNWSFLIPVIDVEFRPWRLLNLVFSLPTLSIGIMCLKFPESPKYLWSIGESEKALNILRKMFQVNTGKSETLYPVTSFELNKKEKVINVVESPKSVFGIVFHMIKQIWNQTAPLFTMPLLPKMIMTSVLQFGIQAGAHGLFMWIPDMFNKMAIFMETFPNDTLTICKSIEYGFNQTSILNTTQVDETINCVDFIDEGVFKITLILGAVASVLFIGLGFVVDILGPKLLLVIILTVTSLAGLMMNFLNDYTLIVTFLCIYQLTNPCINLVLTIQVDLFPTEHRAKAVAVTQMMGRLGAMSGSILIGFLWGYNCYLVFYIVTAIYIMLIVLSCLLPLPFFIRKIKNVS